MNVKDLFVNVLLWIWQNPIPTLVVVIGAWIVIPLLRRAEKRAQGGPAQVLIFVIKWLIFVPLEIAGIFVTIWLITGLGNGLWNYSVDRLNSIEEPKLLGTPVPKEDNIVIQLFPESGENAGGGAPNSNSTPVPGSINEICTVSDKTGATTRSGPSLDYPKIGSIPEGTELEILDWENSNCVDGFCRRAKVKYQKEDVWVHEAALSCSP